MIVSQWLRANAKFVPPVTIEEKSLANRVKKLFEVAKKVAWGHAKKSEKEKFQNKLDKLFDVTSCPHTIRLCSDEESGCQEKQCGARVHIVCDCPKVRLIDMF